MALYAKEEKEAMIKTIEITYYRPGVYGVRPDPENLNFEYLLPTTTMASETVKLILDDAEKLEHEASVTGQ